MLTEQENLYLKAKQDYYQGKPIMSDYEFDELEDALRMSRSSVVNIVGSKEMAKDASHLSPMLSLQKIQVNNLEDKSIPLQKFKDWIKKTSVKSSNLTAEPKFDGSSCNLIFDEGRLIMALTRGNGIEGSDITDKISLIVPNSIDLNYPGLIEIRGEVIIKNKIFNDKYGKLYKNPRNFVAGILGRDEVKEEIIRDFDFIAFDYRLHYDDMMEFGESPFETLSQIGFLVPPFFKKFDSSNFESVFSDFYQYRNQQSEYGLDGFVIKFPIENRKSIGETDHHPKWAMAIKFPPLEAVTTIKRIHWNLGQSGEFKPIGVLDPIELDGTTVQHVALHNIGNIKKQGLFPGSKVTIVKSGDIIPIVKDVIERGVELDNYLPNPCSSDCKIEISGVHLVCTNQNCTEQMIGRLAAGMGAFGLENIGGATISKLYSAGIKTISDLFEKSKFNEDKLIESGFFKSGRALEIIMESFKKRKPITMTRLIASLAFKNVGWSTAKEISKLFTNEIPDWSGKSSAAYLPFLNKESKEYKTVENFIQILKNNGYQIDSELNPSIHSDSIICEFTGSPKSFGFKTKEEYLKEISKYNFIQGKLDKNCKYLITDDIESNSSKIEKAKKLGVKIVTYGELLKTLS